MNILIAIFQWRKRREAIAEQKRKLMQERLARVLNEPSAHTPRRERIETRYPETAAATKA